MSYNEEIVEYQLRGLAANILRCICGAGEPRYILRQIRELSEIAKDTYIPAQKVSSALRSSSVAPYDDVGIEKMIVASMRIAAADLSNNLTARANAVSKFYDGFYELKSARDEAAAARSMRAQQQPAAMPIADANADYWWKQKPAESFVYFISNPAGGAIKIGLSVNPSGRLSSIQTSHHEKLELLGTMHGDEKKETELHAKFAADRLNGEWFKDTPALRQFIADNCCLVAANDNLPSTNKTIAA